MSELNHYFLFTVFIALMGWWGAARLKLPAPAMLGSMIAVSVGSLMTSMMYVPFSMKMLTQAISGAYIGAQITRSELHTIRYLIKPIILLLGMLTINTFFIGILLHEICRIDLTTALLSCVAGGVSDISMIAMDMNADVAMVAMMQTSRLLCVLLFFPCWIRFMTRNEANNLKNQTTDVQMRCPIQTKHGNIIFTVILSIILGYLGDLSNIPAAAMFFPMCAVVILHCTTSLIKTTLALKNTAQLFAGALIGTTITPGIFEHLQTTLLPIGLLLFSYWCVNYIYARINKKYNLLDLKTALFASAPGGASDMALIAADLHVDLTKIAVIQLIRVFYVVAVSPIIIMWFVNLVTS